MKIFAAQTVWLMASRITVFLYHTSFGVRSAAWSWTHELTRAASENFRWWYTTFYAMLLGNIAVNGQSSTAQGPRPIKSIQIKICCPFSMGKCPGNIARQHCSKKLPYVKVALPGNDFKGSVCALRPLGIHFCTGFWGSVTLCCC